MILHYKINLKTFMPLNYYQATWKEGHQNTIYFECMKSPNPFFWKRLIEIIKSLPGSPGFGGR
jgi:hypothetical protein